MRFPLLAIAASFASFHCTRGFVLSGSPGRSRGSADSELHRTYSRGIRSSTNTAMHRRAASGRGSSHLAMSDRLTVGRERHFLAMFESTMLAFVAWRGENAYSSGVVKPDMVHVRPMYQVQSTVGMLYYTGLVQKIEPCVLRGDTDMERTFECSNMMLL